MRNMGSGQSTCAGQGRGRKGKVRNRRGAVRDGKGAMRDRWGQERGSEEQVCCWRGAFGKRRAVRHRGGVGEGQ